MTSAECKKKIISMIYFDFMKTLNSLKLIHKISEELNSNFCLFSLTILSKKNYLTYHDSISNCNYIYRPQRSWGKVLFLQASMILLTAGGDPPPPGGRMATAAGGTHPTGMHSCLSKVYSRIKPCCTLLTNDSIQFRRRASWNSSL